MTKSKTETIERPVWLKYTKEEVKAIILKLANKGLTSEKIGLVLRDEYGIPKVKLYNLKIKHVLDEHKKFVEPTLINLENKVKKLSNHRNNNKQDQKAKRSLIIAEAKLKKTREYHLK